MGIADRTIFALLTSDKRNTRKVTQLKKKLANCQTKNCPKNHSRLRRLKKIHDKDLAEKCTQKDPMAFYDCSDKVFNASKLKQAREEYRTCNETKCVHEYEAIRKEVEENKPFGIASLFR